MNGMVIENDQKKAEKKTPARKTNTKTKTRKRAAAKPKAKVSKGGNAKNNSRSNASRSTIKKPKAPAKAKVNENELAALGFEEKNPETLDICKDKIREAAVLQYKIQEFEQHLKELKQQHHKLTAVELPELCKELRLNSFECDDGVKLKIADFVSGSLPKDESERKTALAYLRKLKGSSLIKTAVNARFDRGDSAAANKVARELKKMGVDFDKRQDVHHGSLSKFARELMEAGKNPDLETLGLYAGTHAKITLPV